VFGFELSSTVAVALEAVEERIAFALGFDKVISNTSPSSAM